MFENPQLMDLVLNEDEEPNEIILGKGFGCITDIKFGADGFLYVVSLTHGKVYQILPNEQN